MNQADARHTLICRSRLFAGRPPGLRFRRLRILIVIRLRIRPLSLFVDLTNLHRSTGLLRRTRSVFRSLRPCANQQQAR